MTTGADVTARAPGRPRPLPRPRPHGAGAGRRRWRRRTEPGSVSTAAAMVVMAATAPRPRPPRPRPRGRRGRGRRGRGRGPRATTGAAPGAGEAPVTSVTPQMTRMTPLTPPIFCASPCGGGLSIAGACFIFGFGSRVAPSAPQPCPDDPGDPADDPGNNDPADPAPFPRCPFLARSPRRRTESRGCLFFFPRFSPPPPQLTSPTPEAPRGQGSASRATPV